MADLNALIAQGAQFAAPVDPFAQYGKMQQLRVGENQNALAQYQLESAKRTDLQQNALNQAYSSSVDPVTGKIDYNKVSAALAAGGAGSQIPAAQKHQFETQQLEATLAKTKEDVRASQSKAIGTGLLMAADNPTDEVLTRVLGGMKTTGIDTTALENIFKTTPDIAQRKQIINSYATQHPEGIAALNFVKPDPFEIKRADGSSIFIDKNPNSPTFKTEVLPAQAAGMTPFQKGTLANQQGQLKVSQDRLAAELSTGDISPSTVDFIAETYRQTGTLPPLGMGAKAATLRSKILGRAAELSMAGGVSAADAAANVKGNKAETAGLTAGQRTAGTQIANVQIAANEANKMIEVAKPYVAAVNPTDYPMLNAAGNYVARNTGDANVVGLATSLNSLVNVYARAINPKGVATVSDKNHAREIINTAMSSGQLNEAFKVMGLEMNAALASGPETRAAMRPGAKPAAAAGNAGTPIYASNGSQRIMSTDDGKTWVAAPAAK